MPDDSVKVTKNRIQEPGERGPERLIHLSELVEDGVVRIRAATAGHASRNLVVVAGDTLVIHRDVCRALGLDVKVVD